MMKRQMLQGLVLSTAQLGAYGATTGYYRPRVTDDARYYHAQGMTSPNAAGSTLLPASLPPTPMASTAILDRLMLTPGELRQSSPASVQLGIVTRRQEVIPRGPESLLETLQLIQNTEVSGLIVIDAAVPDKHLFYQQLKPGVEIREIEAGRNGLEQLRDILSDYRELTSLHIVSHADDGKLFLGNTTVDEPSLRQQIDTFASLNQALKQDADLLLYGCNLAKGEAGRAFLELISSNTHLDVAASNDVTGNPEQGGNWELEIKRGNIETDLAFNAATLKDFSAVLAPFRTTAYNGNEFCDSGTCSSFPITVSDIKLSGTHGVSDYSSTFLYQASSDDEGTMTFYVADYGALESFRLSEIKFATFGSASACDIDIEGFYASNGASAGVVSFNKTNAQTDPYAPDISLLSGKDIKKFTVTFCSDPADVNINNHGLASFTLANHVAPSLNNAPTDISLDSTTINQSTTGVGAVIGNLTTTDADGGDTHTYSLVANGASGSGSCGASGDDDNASFQVDNANDDLETAGSIATGSYSVCVQTDDGTDSYQESFNITVTTTLSASPTLTFTASGADITGDDIATDGEGGSVTISDIDINIFGISDTSGTLHADLDWKNNTFLTSNDGDLTGLTDPNTGSKGMSIKSADGSEFKLAQFEHYNWGETSSFTNTVVGYRDGGQVATTTFDGYDSGYLPQIVSFGNTFSNVDEVRFYISAGGYEGSQAYSNHTINNIQVSSPIVIDSDGDLTASAVVTEPVAIPTMIDTVGEAIDVFDFTLSDGGGGDGLPMSISQIVLNVTGTASDAIRDQVTWRLDGPDTSNVTGTYNAGADTITFSALSISIADSGNETYTVNAYYNDNSGLTEDQTFILSVDGDTDVTTSGSGTGMGATSAVNNGIGSSVDVTATALAFTTQPASSTSGSALGTQPVVTAQDAFGNTDVDFTETVTLSEASAGTLSGDVDIAAVAGVATFTDVAYTATADQESFTLTANDQDGVATDLSTVDANAVTSDVVATKLIVNTEPAPTTIDSGSSTDFTTDPVIQAVDANNTLDTGYSTNILLSVTDPNDGTVDGTVNSMTGTGDADGDGTTVTLTPSSGAATFTDLALQYTNSGASESIALRATSGGLTAVNSSTITSLVNNAPAIANLDSDSVSWAGIGNTVTLDSGGDATGSDTELDALNGANGDYSGGSLTVQRAGGSVTSDTLGFNTSGALFTVNGSDLQDGGQTFATFTNTNGVLTISFTGSGTAATTALVSDVMQRITYRNDAPAGDATVRFTLSDGSKSDTADVTVTSDSVYITETTDTATIDPTDGTSFSEAIAIAAADGTGSQTLILDGTLAAQTVSASSATSLTESLTLDLDSASGVTLSGGTLSLGGGVNLTLNNGSSDTASISTVFAGTGSLAKTGDGTVTLTGTQTYSGTTTFTGGTVSVAGDSNLGSGQLVMNGGTLVVTSSGTIDNTVNLAADSTISHANDLTLSGLLSGAANLSKAGAGQMNVTNSGNEAGSSGGITITEGKFYISDDDFLPSGTITMNGGSFLASGSSGQSDTVDNNFVVGAAGGTFHIYGGGGNYTLYVTGVISGSGDLEKITTAALVLSGTNTYTGNFTLSAGNVSITDGSNLGSGTVTLNGGTLTVTGSDVTISNDLVASGGTLSNANNVTWSGVISGSGGLTKAGAGTLTLSGTQTHSGSTNITAGDVSITDDTNIGSGSVTLNGGGLTVTGTGTIDNAISMGSSNGTVTHANAVTLSGVISGTGSLTKAGAGTLTLSATNTNSGTLTLSAGKTVVTNSIAGPVSVGNTATLESTGSFSGLVTVNSGGTLQTGASPGTMTLGGGLTLDSGGTLVARVNGTSAGTTYDQYAVSGTVTLGGTLSVIGSYTGTGGESYTLINNDSNDAVSSTFNGLAEGNESTTLNGIPLAVSYVGSTGNDVVLSTAGPDVTDGNITLSGATGTGGAYKIGDTVTVTWDDTAATGDNNGNIASVTVDFSAFGGGAAVAASNTSDTWTATYVIPSGAIDSTNLNVSVTATDTNGVVTTTADTSNATLDNIGPSVSGVTSSTANGTYKVGDAISVQVTFSEVMTVTGTPQLTLETGDTDQVVDYASGSGTSVLTFTYTVQAGDTSADLDYLNTTALALNGGTIADAAGNAATLTLATPGAANSLGDNKALVVDTTAPSGHSVALDDATINAGEASSQSFTFTGAEVGTTYDYSISSSGGGTAVTGSGTVTDASQQLSGLDVSGLGDGTLTLSVTLTDTAGNAATAVTDTATLDTTAPNGQSVAFDDTTINSSEAASISFTFSGAEVGAGYSYTINSSGGGTAVTGSGTIASAGDQISGVNVSGLSDGTLTLSVTLTDSAGNAAAAVTDTATLDAASPSGHSVSFDDGTVNGAESTAISFTFSGAEIGADHSYTISSSGGGTPVTGTGTIASAGDQVSGIDVSGLPGGTLTLSVTLTDSAGNAAAAVTDTATLDTAAPVLTEVSVTTLTNDSTPDIQLSTTDAGTLAVGGSCGSGNEGAVESGSQTITLTDIDNSSALADNSYSDCTLTVTDATGNASNALTLTTFTVDTTGPTLGTNTGATTAEGDSVDFANTDLAASDTNSAAANVRFTLTAVPANGVLSSNGVDLGISDSFTQADVDAGNLSYSHDGGDTTSDSFTFALSDELGNVNDNSGGGFTTTLAVTAVNDAPSLTASGEHPTFTEGDATAASLFSNTSISTVESGQTLTAMELTVSHLADGLDEKLLVDGSLLVLTDGAGGTTAGNSLSYSISLSGSTATVTLTGGTLSVADAQTLVDSLGYRNSSEAPDTADRVVTLTSLTDSGGGHDSVELSVASLVTVVGVNDLPVIGELTDLTVTENDAATLLWPAVTLSDAEGNFNGGILGVSGLLEEDIVSIRNVGSGAGEIGFDGTTVSYEGTAIGIVTGGSGATLGVTLNASATVVAVDVLIENLTYENSSEAPTATRTLTLNLTDAAGGALVGPTAFSEITTADNPFNGVSVGNHSHPTLGDLDGDGDLDAFIGQETNGLVNYFENTGTDSAPVFVQRTGGDNPLDGVASSRSKPVLVDIDGDSDLDAFIGSASGDLRFFENTGSANAASFTEVTGAGNPFNGVDVGTDSSPAFVDLDDDGDKDALIGDFGGNLRYFENTGTAAALAFTEQTGANNPFDGLAADTSANPALLDVDRDGDLDLFLGGSLGQVQFFRNTGTAGAPAFVEETGGGNPFDGVDYTNNSAPNFADINNDGNPDAFVGEWDGSLNFFEGASDTTAIVSVTAVADAPLISGTPTTTVPAEESYRFTPVATDPDGDPLTFSIANKPVWASFDTTTGRLSGTPELGDVGLSEGIVITVSDGDENASLPAFSLRVTDNSGGSQTVDDSDQPSGPTGSGSDEDDGDLFQVDGDNPVLATPDTGWPGFTGEDSFTPVYSTSFIDQDGSPRSVRVEQGDGVATPVVSGPDGDGRQHLDFTQGDGSEQAVTITPQGETQVSVYASSGDLASDLTSRTPELDVKVADNGDVVSRATVERSAGGQVRVSITQTTTNGVLLVVTPVSPEGIEAEPTQFQFDVVPADIALTGDGTVTVQATTTNGAGDTVTARVRIDARGHLTASTTVDDGVNAPGSSTVVTSMSGAIGDLDSAAGLLLAPSLAATPGQAVTVDSAGTLEYDDSGTPVAEPLGTSVLLGPEGVSTITRNGDPDLNGLRRAAEVSYSASGASSISRLEITDIEGGNASVFVEPSADGDGFEATRILADGVLLSRVRLDGSAVHRYSQPGQQESEATVLIPNSLSILFEDRAVSVAERDGSMLYVEAHTNGSVRHEVARGGRTTQAISRAPGSRTRLEGVAGSDDVQVVTEADVDGRRIRVIARSDGFANHRLVNRGGRTTESAFDLEGTTTSISSQGTLKSRVRLGSGDVCAWVETFGNGETSTGFGRYDADSASCVDIQRPTNLDNAFEAGNQVQVQADGESYSIIIETRVTRPIRF